MKGQAAMKYCYHCGAVMEVSAASFCLECGAELVQPKPKRPPAPPTRPSLKRKKKKPRPQTQTKSAPVKRRTAEDGYDGYYKDTPVADGGQARIGLDPILAKKIAILAFGVLLVIGLALLAMKFL
jgi:predicted  nucleic acid-binding Zn-ribbon protein